MDLLYVLDYRFYRSADGRIWTASSYAESFWERYLTVFDHVHVISRALEIGQPEKGWQRVDGHRVKVHVVPFYRGPEQYVLRFRAVRRAMEQALDREGAVILRIPSQLATCAESILERTKRTFGVEVVGDPWESLAPGSVQHPLRPLFRWHYARNQRRQCKNALAASYVSAHLQQRYPPGDGHFQTVCSDVYLPAEAFAGTHAPRSSSAPLRIVTVASLEQAYKGIDTLLEAVAARVACGTDLHLSVVGDGKYRAALEARAARPDLAGRVEFLGQLPAGQAVRDVLSRATLVVLPSRTEGMPRALLEAMALGLPCLGTRVGGVPEVLHPEDTFPPNDVHALTAKLLEVTGRPDRLEAMSQRNYEMSLGFREQILRLRRDSFYSFLRASVSAALRSDLSCVDPGLPWWKRPLDVIGASALAIVTLPLWLGAAAWIRVRLGSPVLFRQPRAGRGGRAFVLYKFRTMRDSTGARGQLLPDAERLTRSGRWLRRLSIDELPQLWNVLRGDMSLVGPRPLLLEYLPLYSDEQRRRHEVNPGLTGWAQIHGRNGLLWPQRFELDVWYVDHQSLARDLQILVATVGSVLRGGGVSQPGHATMTPFDGASRN